MTVEKDVEVLKERMRDFDSRLQEVEGYRNPLSVEGRLISTMSALEDITNKLSEISNKMKAFEKDDRFVEIFTDEELKELYIDSALSTNQLKLWIENNLNEGKSISLASINNYIYGNIKNLVERSALGRYLRFECIQKEKVLA
jgi:hypothetical protein